MEKFEKAEIEVINISAEDVIVTSGCSDETMIG